MINKRIVARSILAIAALVLATQVASITVAFAARSDGGGSSAELCGVRGCTDVVHSGSGGGSP
jgi:hypothetical protein